MLLLSFLILVFVQIFPPLGMLFLRTISQLTYLYLFLSLVILASKRSFLTAQCKVHLTPTKSLCSISCLTFLTVLITKIFFLIVNILSTSTSITSYQLKHALPLTTYKINYILTNGKRKRCLSYNAGNLGRWWIQCPLKPPPKILADVESFKGNK